MASKSDTKNRSASPPRRRARPAARKAAPVAVEDDGNPAPGAAKRLLRAGLKALGDVQGDVLSRQARIFEVLLGIGQSPGWPRPGLSNPKDAASDPFGKFEHVFDERVARSLARLGMPTAQALQELSDRVDQLTEALRRLESARRKP